MNPLPGLAGASRWPRWVGLVARRARLGGWASSASGVVCWFGAVLGSFLCHFMVHLGSFWGHLGTVLVTVSGPLWSHYGVIMEPIWNHYGAIMGPLFGRYGAILCQHVAIVDSPIWLWFGFYIRLDEWVLRGRESPPNTRSPVRANPGYPWDRCVAVWDKIYGVLWGHYWRYSGPL